MINLEKLPSTRTGWVLSNGFRPLFTLVVLQALLALAGWLAFLNGWVNAPASMLSPLLWHGHEMLFGFVGAAIGGFLLAAVANWTGRKPVSGMPLVLLGGCWLLARAIAFWGGEWAPLFNAAGATGYWLLLACVFGRELILAGNRRNLKVVVILGVFALLSVSFHLEWLPGLTVLHLCMVLVWVLLTLIGGRITPAFTRNWLNRQAEGAVRLPATQGRVDVAVSLLTPVAGMVWAFWPQSRWGAMLLMLAGALQLVRLARWHGWQTWREPLLWALHLGYAWLGVGLLLLSGSMLGLWSSGAGIHALTVGAMGGMIMAVASRAALGHTGRALEAGKRLLLALVCLHLAAVLRVTASLWPSAADALIDLSGLIWILAFGLFAWRYLPILLGPSISFSERLKAQR